MVNKKKRLFKLLFFPISLLLCLSIFLINSFAMKGYEIQSNGDIKSLNFWALEQNYTLTQPDYVFYNQDLSLDSGDFTLSFEFYGSSSSAQIKFYNSEDTPVYDYVFTVVYGLNSFHFNLSNSTSKVLLYSNAVGVYGNFMLSSGLVVRDYFPYGYYSNNDVSNRMSLYNLFNGSTVSLNGYYDNLGNSYTMAIDVLDLSVDQKFITLDDLPTIKNVINDGRIGSDWIVNADTYYISFYLNRQQANFNILFADFVSSRQYIRLSGSSSGLYDKFIYNTNENSQSFILSTNGVEYTNIALFNELGYNQNFKIGLSFSSSAYNDGYNDGYTSAINSSDAFNSGFNSGYQDGYNDGINTDLQTNGLRTLFNSILSFPVDMIKSVFNFEFMGVNIASVIMFIVSIGIVAFVLKKFL